jgi:hypothetical protein
MSEQPTADDANVGFGVGDEAFSDRFVHSDDMVHELDDEMNSPTVIAEVRASDAEAQVEIDVDDLRAADAAVSRAAAERMRLIARVHENSLRNDALRAVAIDARRQVTSRAADGDGSARPSEPSQSARAAGGLHAMTAVRTQEISERSARAEIAMALGMSEGGAGGLVDAATAMRRRHPDVLAAMAVGAVRERHATRLVRAIADLPDDAAGRVVAAALPQADRAFSKFGAIVDRLVFREHPQSPEERHTRAVEDRAAWITDDLDGMAVLSQLMPSVEAHAIMNRAKSMASALANNPDETRTSRQLVADVLRDLLIDGETRSLPDSVRGIRPTVFITVPALAAATGDDQFGIAEVDGIGPIDLETATKLIGAGSEWTRIITHPLTGMVLDIDRKRYRPPAGIARLARWMYGTCTFPGCRSAAHRCELDHIRDWCDGGTTCISNLHPMCTGHHTIKHATQWRVDPEPGGGVTWTSPGGQRFTTPPKAPWRVPSRRVPSQRVGDPAPF